MSGHPLKNWSRRWRFVRKELQETLRDRRTIMTLVLMPLLVYPLLGITFQKFFLTQFATQEATEYILAFEDESTAMKFRDLFSQGNRLLGKESSPGTPLPGKPGETPEPQLKFAFPEAATPMDVGRALQQNQADVGIRIQDAETDAEQRLELVTVRGSVLGRQAVEYLEQRLRAVNENFVQEYLRSQPVPVRLPVSWQTDSLVGVGTSQFSLATLVPLVLILMTVTGAVYPAIDLTAGERERGTLEALIASPVSRREILIAKYVAVVTVAILTAVMNVLAMIATAYGTGLEQTLFGPEGLNPRLIGLLFLLLTSFAGFFSAMILAVTSVARSFKEAQAYLIPLMMLSMAPGVLGLMPGLEMSLGLALTPLVNMVVVTRDLLDGQVPLAWVLVTAASSLMYALLALSVASRIFGTDSVLYGSAGTWQELLQRPNTSRSFPTLTQGMVAVAVLLPAYILLGSLPGRLTDWALTSRLGVSAGLTVLLFVVWPWGLCQYLRIQPTPAFRWNWPRSVLAWPVALLAGCCLWPFAYELEILTIPAERLQRLVDLFGGLELELQQVPLWWKLTALAVVPAICEELFFRGFLFRSFHSSWNAGTTIVLTAVLFGLFHVLVRDVLMLERFLPTALMGLALGWVAYRTGSVLPGMLLHVVHNGSLLLLPVWFPQWGDAATTIGRTHLPGWSLLAAGTGVIVSAAVMVWATRRDPQAT